jgi:uncharacterized protein (DUF58 family)
MIQREALLFAGLPIFTVFFIFTPWRPAQFLCLFFIFLILSSRIYSEYLIRHLSLIRADSEIRGFRYEWIDVELAVENTGHLPAFMLAVGDTPGMLAVFRDHKSLSSLPGKRRRMLRWQGYGADRGLFILGPGQIRGSDPLGLFPFTLTTGETTRLFVYPAPGFIHLTPPAGIPLGVLVSTNPFHEDLTRRRSLREYTGGDELRRINWKASARMGTTDSSGLIVNEYEASLSYPLMVFLNADPSEYPAKNREPHFERVIEAAASLCIMASRERQALGLMLYTGRTETGEVISPSAFALIPILERLAILKRRDIQKEEELWENRGSISRLLEAGKTLPFGTRVVYTGPSLDNDEWRILEGMRGSHLSLEYLMIDAQSLARLPRCYQIKEWGYEIL